VVVAIPSAVERRRVGPEAEAAVAFATTTVFKACLAPFRERLAADLSVLEVLSTAMFDRHWTCAWAKPMLPDSGDSRG